MRQAITRRSAVIAVPPELAMIGGFTAALFFVVASGAGLSSLLPAHASMWMNAGAYGAPAAIAFAAYWWVAQKL